MLELVGYLFLIFSFIAWVSYFLLTRRNFLYMPHISEDTPVYFSKEKPPMVTIVIPTRNEENRIINCIKTLQSQTYQNFKVIIVDDSTDKTIEVITNIVGNDTRFKIIKQKPLKDGWIGKPFAVQQGFTSAEGEWLLFIDADTYYDPMIIEKSVSYAIQNNLDMLSISPRHICKTFWEKVIQPIPLGIIPAISPLTKVNDPKSNVALALGPYILIKNSVFQKVGGYESIKGCIADDIELAKLVKTSGHRIGIANGQSLMNLRMYERFHDIWEGWEKNIFFGFVQSRQMKSKIIQILFLFAMTCAIFIIMTFPILSLIVSGVLFIFTMSSVLEYFFLFSLVIWIFSILIQVYVQRSYAIGNARYAPLVILLGGIIILGIFLNSGIKTLRGKGVIWKGRTYAAKK